MKYVKQKHAGGCAIAAVAMLTNLSYREALKVVAPNHQKGTRYHGTFIEAITFGLGKLGIRCRVRYPMLNKRVDLSKLKRHACIAYTTPKGNGHAVVWDCEKKRVLDPNNICPRPVSYIQRHMRYLVEIISS